MRQYKLPTIVAILTITLLVGVSVLLVQSKKVFRPQASLGEAPRQVRVTNVKDRSFTVSWVTDKPTQGFISYGQGQLLGAAIPQEGRQSVHYITVENINPLTNYYFKIGSGEETFDNNGSAYQVKTGSTLSNLPAPDVIFGNVVSSTGAPAAGVVVYAIAQGLAPISTITDKRGRWTIPLSTARTTNLSSWATYDKNKTTIEIYVQGANNSSSARVYTEATHPVPTITLGQTHDFTAFQSPVGQGDSQKDSLPLSQISFPEEESRKF